MTNKNLKRLIYNKKTEKYLVNSQIISIFAAQSVLSPSMMEAGCL